VNSEQRYFHPVDGGPIYFESDFSAFIAEPWNMASALVFVLIAGYWIYKSAPIKKQTPFVFYASILLLIGGIGGSLYHGFRNSEITLLMDWVPILLLVLGASVYFLKFSTGTWKLPILAVLILFTFEFINWNFAPARMNNNISYILMALTVLVPTFLVLRKIKFKGWKSITLAFSCFILALIFRIFDRDGLLPMGTHFLWHSFGAVATFFMFRFVWKLEQQSEIIPSN